MPKHELLVKMETMRAKYDAAVKSSCAATEEAVADLVNWIEEYGPESSAIPPAGMAYKAVEAHNAMLAAEMPYDQAKTALELARTAAAARVEADRGRYKDASLALDESSMILDLFYGKD